ncbi:MAG: hypothetical protein ABIW46_06965, partial [Acidimicrobiales bacterium]
DLDEGTGLRCVSLVADLGDGGMGGGGVVVLCSHGDVIPTVVESLGGPGIVDGLIRCKKGSTWVLVRDVGSGRLTADRYLPPPG